MKRMFCVILIITLSLGGYPIVSIEAKEMSNSEALKERYFDKNDREYEQMEKECEKIRQRYEKIQAIEKELKELCIEDKYVRCYYNGENCTIQLIGKVCLESFDKYIKDNDIIVEYVEFSEEDLLSCENMCNNILKKVNNLTIEERRAVETVLGVNINYDNNCVDVCVSDKSKNNLKILKSIFNMDEIRFIEQETSIPTVTSVQLGRGYYFTYQGEAQRASIGYRARMTNISTGEIMYGFVTCGHISHSAMFAGNAIYFDKACTKKLGNIKLITFNSTTKCDYAFIKVTSDYSMSNIVYYNTVYGRTENGTKISNKYATKDELLDAKDINSTIYKAGSSSYLTSGRIKAVSSETNSYGVNLEKMVKTDIYATGGDSGGIVYGYIKRDEKYYWMVIGIISCGNDEYTWVQPAYRATNYYSTYKIVPY